MNLRYIDWIWQIRGSLPLPPQQSGDDAFDRLDPLFREYGTSQERTKDRLIFRKKDQAAQDRMAVFDGGVLQIERQAGGPVLRYRMTSRILLFCFLAPLLFLAFAQITIALGAHQKASTEAAGKSAKTADKAHKPEDKVIELNPIDKFLGAPAPDKPKKKDGEAGGGKKPSPTAAYVFAGMFAFLYVVGRILEDRKVKTLFRQNLLGS